MNERKLRKLILKSVPFDTTRLLIRPIEMADVNDMYSYASLEDVCRFLLWSPHLNPDATRGYIEFLQQRYRKGLYADWAIELKENGKMIGTCGYANINATENFCEIGYVLSPMYQGKGLMTEAVGKLLELSFEVFGFNYAKLRIMSENRSSIALAERLGFSFDQKTEMVIKESNCTVFHYILEKEKFKKIKKEAVD